MNTDTFDFREARRQCMNFGLRVAILWSASFLCSMYAPKMFLLSWLSLGLAFYSLLATARMIRDYNRLVARPTWLRSGWMIFITYFYATLLTTLVQYIYFRFLDNGQLASNIEALWQLPAYQNLAQRVEWETAKAMITSPTQMTYSLFIYNAFLGAFLTLPTLLLAQGMRQKTKG